MTRSLAGIVAAGWLLAAGGNQFIYRMPSSPTNPIAAVRMPSNSQTLPDSVWSTVGVEGGIPSGSWSRCTTGTGTSVIAAYTGSGSTIQAALDGCDANHYVELGAGAFTLSSGFSFESNRALRGQGANSTFVVINGQTAGNSCGYAYTPAIGMCASSSAAYTGDSPTISWSAGYAPATTRITVGDRSNIVAGSTIIRLDQLDESSDGYPASGDVYICSTGSAACVAQGGGYGYSRSGRASTQIVKAVACVGGSCTGSGDVDIAPPITMPHIRSARTPQALWPTSTGDILSNAGIEDLSLDFSGICTSDAAGLLVAHARNVWFKGLRTLYTSCGSAHFTWVMINSVFVTLRDSYIYDSSSVAIASYAIQPNNVCGLLIENNIVHQNASFVPNGPMCNSVFAYNFMPGLQGPLVTFHGGGAFMDLFEGNISMGFYQDADHGTNHFMTLYRNAMVGDRYKASGCNICNPVHLQSYSRFYNVVGNVMGDASLYSTYQTLDADSGSSIYVLGWKGSASGFVPANDGTRVRDTLFRWGNWDQVTSTADNTDGDQTGTRWCASGHTGFTTTCSSTSEVPSGITNYPNAIPSAETLPNSLYLSAKPSWFQSLHYPPVGPDQSGGNVTNLGGHVYLNPAANCYLNTMSGPTNGSGSVLAFDRVTCYGS